MPTALIGAAGINPVMLEPGKLIYSDAFEISGPVDKEVWQTRQGTRWEIKDGKLVGMPSSLEYQEKKKKTGKGHLGKDPRVYLLNTPQDFVCYFKMKFDGGTSTPLLPIIESGHHIARVYMGEDRIVMLADHEQEELADLSEGLRIGVWYEVLMEMKGDEFVVQLNPGGVLRGRHVSYSTEERSLISVAGTREGTLLIDDFYLWEAGKRL